jgi:hypothetical protein
MCVRVVGVLAPVLPLVSPSTLLLFFGPTTFLFTIHYCKPFNHWIDF